MTRRIDRSLTAASLPPLERSAWVEVAVDRLEGNARALAALAAPAAIAPVVKADGYGHGLEVAARCAVAGGAKWLCVADSGEASRLRRDGYRGRILVLYPVPLLATASMSRLGVDVTVGDVDSARALAGQSRDHAHYLPVHLEVDTGMTRGGIAPGAAIDAADALTKGPGTRLAGVWTHLAAPEDPEFTRGQLEVLRRVLSRLTAEGIVPGEVHAAASGGLLTGEITGHTLVRPGLAFYGLHPGAGRPLPHSMSPALEVKAHPVRLTEVPAGTRVGYGGTWAAAKTARIATLPVGYADGWSRSSSPGTTVLVEGRRAPVVGRVSSDSLTVDVTAIGNVRLDSEFTLLGGDGPERVPAEEVAAVRGTISWEVLQQLGARLSRIYTSGGHPIAIRAESSIDVVVGKHGRLPGYRHSFGDDGEGV